MAPLPERLHHLTTLYAAAARIQREAGRLCYALRDRLPGAEAYLPKSFLWWLVPQECSSVITFFRV